MIRAHDAAVGTRHRIAVSCTTSSKPLDLDAALSPGFADARLGLLMFALFEGGSESLRNRLDLR